MIWALSTICRSPSQRNNSETLCAAASWNIGMLIDRAAKRFLALCKGHDRDQENRLKAVKDSVKPF